MKTIRLAILSLATFVGSLVASAQQASTEAFVSSLTGTATVTAPGSDKAVPVVLGQKLPEGSSITTGADTTLMVQSFDGIQTGLGSNSTVVVGAHSVSADGLRTAVIDLKQGTTVSVLDPTKRAVNNYAVRTPKGVAAARGTIYQTTVQTENGVITVRVNTVTGAVSFATASGTYSVKGNESMDSNATAPTPVGEAYNNTNATSAQKEALAEALKVAAYVVGVLEAKGEVTSDKVSLGSFTSAIGAANSDLADDIQTSMSAGETAGKNATKVEGPNGPTITVPAPASTTPKTDTVDPTIVISGSNP